MHKDLALIEPAIEALSEALEELPAQNRQVLLLHRIEGLSQEEIAVRLGIDRHTVEQRLCEALGYLQRRLFQRWDR